MAEQIDVINLALSHIAQFRITAAELLANSTPATQAALRIWDLMRKEVLRAYEWGFAKVQAELTVVASTTYDPAVYAYAYEYPSSCLAVRKVNVQTELDKAISGKYEKMYDVTNDALRIVTDIEDAYIEYTYDHETESLWDSAFVIAFGRRLAAGLAKPLNGDDTQAAEQGKLFAIAISEAKRLDASSKHESHDDSNRKSNYADARG